MRLQLIPACKKTACILLCLGFSFALLAQGPEPYRKKKLPKTELQLLYTYYQQNGRHSAVTGGLGTERLSVNSPRVSVKVLWDSLQSFSLYGGTDVITSASTDRIDFAVSSASRRDARVYGTVDYGRQVHRKGWWAGLNYSFSGESDYTSHAVGLWVSRDSPDQMQRWYGSFRAYFDDLRWGKLYWQKEFLIYPQELRDTTWFDIHNRYTWHFSLSYFRVLNQRMNVGIFPDLVIQNGLLSTPWHRVYFREGSDLRVENLPRQRLKVPVGVRYNWFFSRLMVLRAYYRFYWDNFHLVAHTVELELPLKVGPQITLIPHGRIHTQTAARYFAPFEAHRISDAYYTSDFDLSGFSAWQTGLGIRWVTSAFLGKSRLAFTTLEFRYAYYDRSDGLWAHWFSLLLGARKN